jgi:hypothetical protein
MEVWNAKGQYYMQTLGYPAPSIFLRGIFFKV